MIAELITAAARRRLRQFAARRRREAATILPGLDTRPAPMEPLHPPEARNDNPLDDVTEAVEDALRAEGYLR